MHILAESLAGGRWTLHRAAPSSARLLASVPPDVKIVSVARAPTSDATSRRALSTIARALRPAVWTDEGLPLARSASTMASNAAGLRGLVALWSM